MSMSLDYMGKFVLILVAVAVGVGLIMTLQGDIGDWVPNNLGGDDRVDSEVVDVSGAGDIASLISLCYEESRKRSHEDFVCFIARHEGGGFGSISAGEINSNLNADQQAQTDLSQAPYTGDSVVIRYDVANEQVVVEN